MKSVARYPPGSKQRQRIVRSVLRTLYSLRNENWLDRQHYEIAVCFAGDLETLSSDELRPRLSGRACKQLISLVGRGQRPAWSGLRVRLRRDARMRAELDAGLDLLARLHPERVRVAS